MPAPRAAHPVRGLLTIFFSPAETFDGAGRNPWLVPLIAATVLAVLLNVMIINVMGMGTIIRNQLESNPKIAERLGADKVNQMALEADRSSSRKLITYAASAAGFPVFLLILAGITYAALLATGAVTTFPATLGATAWSSWAVLLLTATGTAVFLVSVNDFTGVDPRNMVILNASVFFDIQTTPAWVRSLAAGIDLIAFYGMYLRCVGLTRLSQRVSMAQAAGVTAVLYLCWIIGKAGFSAVFG